ncbi:MAG TPA: glycoside hydrolase family 3 C-terminal domain-containing protein [Thermomicrobiales bacterium]|nr:glycoside hydrolase family 3 C-terminal domain-containing protein [Thermomicrobiales bacterium]
MSPKEIASVVDLMTLEEQVSLLAGAGFWRTGAIERLGVPSIKVSDGPNGARGEGAFSSGVKAASFPVGISLASTWDPDLVSEIGAAIAQEAKTKRAQVVLAPTVNIHRSPLGGRNFESFSEDPWLAGILGAAYVSGMQSQGIAATVKHFTGNESEFERMSINSVIGERALREIYLRPFEIAVRQARPWAVMAAYNRLNGTFCSDNHRLLTEILRDEWGFDGFVMSDWTGTRSTAAAINAGLDLEMPGPAKQRGEKLVAAARTGEAHRSAIAASAGQIVRLAERVGASISSSAEEQAVDDPRHRELIRRAGASGTVLLTNNGVLPLDRRAITSIAVVGPNAAVAQIMGGGSSQINAHYRVSPLDGIRAAVPDGVDVRTAPGCDNRRLLPAVQAGVHIEYFANDQFEGEPAHSEDRAGSDIMWLGHIAPGVDIHHFSARLTTVFEPDRADRYEVGVVSSGPVRVLINDQVVVDQWDTWQAGGEYFGLASREYRGSIDLKAGTSYQVIIENRTPDQGPEVGLKALRLGIARPTGDDELDEAVQLAAGADVAIVCVGLNGEWDTEGMDRPDMDLPGRQNHLVERVADANPNTIVVLQSGGPLTLQWVDDVAAVMQAWYPGQECGNAIADLLFGDVNPSGKLPMTWPRSLANNPTTLSFPGERGVAEYREGLFVGYRFYEAMETPPLFAFGHGLSYSTFAYESIRLSASELKPGDHLTVDVEVRNVSDRAGAEIVQLFVRDPESVLRRPRKELKGFARVELAAGSSGSSRLTLDMRSLAYFDDQRNAWVADAGEFEIMVGPSSDDIRLCASVTLANEWVESAQDAWRSTVI